MTKIFKVPFATQGDRAAIPDDIQADGALSYVQGYGYGYERDQVTDPTAKDIEREKMNGICYSKSESDSSYQPKGNYTPAGNYTLKGDSYTKTESDNSYQPKGSYQAAGYSYSKAESNNTYQPKGNYQAAGHSYSKNESDQRYIVTGNRGVSNVVLGVNLDDGESANLNQDCRGKVMWVHSNETSLGGTMTIIPYDGYQVTTHYGAQGRLTLTLANNGRAVKVIYTQSGTRLKKIDVWS